MRALLLACLVLCCGCYLDPKQRIVGNWMVDSRKTEVPKVPFEGAEKQIRSLLSNASVKFSADGSAIFTGPVPVEGKWTLEENQVRLVPKDGKLLGRIPFVGDEVVFQISPGFDHLTWTVESPFGPVKLVLLKTG